MHHHNLPRAHALISHQETTWQTTRIPLCFWGVLQQWRHNNRGLLRHLVCVCVWWRVCVCVCVCVVVMCVVSVVSLCVALLDLLIPCLSNRVPLSGCCV